MVVRIALFTFLALISAAQAKPLLVDDAQFAALMRNAKRSSGILRKCEKEVVADTHAIVDFAPIPHYTAQGTNPDDDQAKGLTGDFRRAYHLALCYRLNGNSAYALQTQHIIDAWAMTMKQASNPQGRSDINFNIAQLVVAASWVEEVNAWNTTPFKNWLKLLIGPLSLSAEPNNRGNWGNLQDISIAAFTQEKPALSEAATRWQTLVTSEIAEDGTMPLEICRSNSSNHCDGPDKGVNGLAYTHYALLPILLAAQILDGQGVDVFNSKVASLLQSAFAKAADFTANPAHFPYYDLNHGKLNKPDHCAYFALALKHFPNQNARAVLNVGTCKSDIWQILLLF